MPLEIERKFLVEGDAWRDEASDRVEFRQGYLTDESGRSSIRVRIDEEESRLNIKAAVVGAARAEYDYGIPREDALEIFEKLCVGRVEKTRHYVERDGVTWEIDEFHGDNAGLVVAEVELQSETQAIVRPSWLGREVTDDRRYYNHNLALRPYRKWDAS